MNCRTIEVNKLHSIWFFIVSHWIDIEIAAGFALFFGFLFALAFELFDFGSRLRGRIRRIKSRLSEGSISRLEKRIEEQERYRTQIASYLSSDKALYLAIFKIVIALLLSIICGATCIALREILLAVETERMVPPLRLFSLMFFTVGIAGAFQGIKLTGLDTKPKVSQIIEQLDSEIGDLKRKFESKIRLKPAGKVFN